MESAAENTPRAPIGALRAGLSGLVDRFAWPLRASHYLELVNPRWATHALHARVVDADAGTSLLRVAEAAGLDPPHGCRMGICHSCTVTLRAGCVRDLRNNTTTDEPGSRVQLCVCAAAGDVELEV